MPSLRKRRLPSGKTSWDIRYWEKGKQRVYTVGETDRRTATKIYNEFCSQLAEGRYDGTQITVDEPRQQQTKYTVTDLAAHALTYAEANKSRNTLEREQLVFNRIIHTIGNLPLEELTASKIEEYKAARLRLVTATTLNIEIRMLNTAVNQGVAMGWLTSQKVVTFKQIRTPDAEPLAWLSEEQVDVLLSTGDREFQRFMQFLLNTGCRRNEVLGITWADIDLQKRQITVRGQIGKMGKRRTVPINNDLLTVLTECDSPREGRVFPNYKPNQVSMKFRRWRGQIGLPSGISIHSLRATFASHLIRNGVDIFTVSKLLGHSSVKVTEKHYLALDPAHVRSAVNQLNFRTGRGPDGKPNGEGG